MVLEGIMHSCETQLLLTIEDLGKISDKGYKLIYRFLISARPLTRYPIIEYSQNLIIMAFTEKRSLGLIRGLQADFSV